MNIEPGAPIVIEFDSSLWSFEGENERQREEGFIFRMNL